MNPNINLALAALSGALAGSVITFLVTRETTANKVRKDVEDLVSDAEIRIMKKYKVGPWGVMIKYNEADVEATDQMFEDASVAAALEFARINEYVAEPVEDEADGKVVAGNVFDHYESVPAPEEESDDEEPFVGNPTNDDPEPYCVSEDEYNFDMEDFQKMTLSFYAGDSVLADEIERVVEDVESTVGLRNLETFAPDNEVLYIRNNRLQVGFEVILENAKYSEVVMGLDTTPSMERRGRKRRLEE